jgi:DNA polymerase III delta subunit
LLILNGPDGKPYPSLLKGAKPLGLNSLSLFAEKRLIELRIREARFGDGKKILQACAENPPDDAVFLIITSRIDSKTSKTKWFSALALNIRTA